jgi:hypothetical protein
MPRPDHRELLRVPTTLADVEGVDLYVGVFGFRYGYVPLIPLTPGGLGVVEASLTRSVTSSSTHSGTRPITPAPTRPKN